jgi:hypothetical protein
LKYAVKNKDWTGICEVIERINEELNVVEKVDYVSPRDRDEEPGEEDDI